MDLSLNFEVLGQLHSAKAKTLYDLYDSLRAYTRLQQGYQPPRIIVIGEQSSGKSSVLEAISHVRFPVQENLCTRFATELICRRASKTRIDASVRFEDQSRDPQSFQRNSFQEDDLPDIIEDAKKAMGLKRNGKFISKDVLQLEIEGPDIYPLHLVDLPGLFPKGENDQELGDKEAVEELVDSYIRKKNSIALVVITPNVKLNNQVALKKVNFKRTLGIITKLDLTRARSSNEKTYIRLAHKEIWGYRLALGWHVLRNRAEDETSLQCRDEIEDLFFQESAWSSVPEADRGIDNLRKKLSQALYERVKNTLPAVIEDIEDELADRRRTLKLLGNPRANPEDMRSVLISVAVGFQRIVRDGVYGKYQDDFFISLNEEETKLRSQVRNYTRAFDYVMRFRGTEYEVIPEKQNQPERCKPAKYLTKFVTQYENDDVDMEYITKEDFSYLLAKKATFNQGLEFPGFPSHDLAVQLFKYQAMNWKMIAEQHADLLLTVAKAFVDRVFQYIFRPGHTKSEIEAFLFTCVDPFFEEKRVTLRAKIDELWRPYDQCFAFPLDDDFYQGYSQKQADRLADQVYDLIRAKVPTISEDDNKKKVTRKMIREAIASKESSDEDEFGTSEVIDSMTVYYEMSRRTFTENVVNLAIESCLICDLPNILTPSMVDQMSKERLAELVGESEETTSRREVLLDEIEVLRNALAQCQRYKPRPITGA
ncbi:hypothetical protein F53441_10909 [Fusarium austroafricanum]|uniref:GED domain-containing protein n=1 Tax=Fusarium austroafricanum TaxID=2364996 RepID=A0A8H4K636_9HYPO|nr:hypothetical protein F53441_10909 [Fusarium austroafricanum]